MRSEDRRDLATATTGAAGMSAGGVMRHTAVRRLKATSGVEPKVHMLGVLRNGTKGQKRLFGAGSLLGLAATPALAVGTTRLVTGRDIEKADERPRGFWAEGLRGSASALKGRGENALQPVPKEIRATQLGAAVGAGFGGSALARAAMRGRAKAFSPAIAPVIGGLTATASVPATNRAVQRRNPEYRVTAYGVQRNKTAAVKPSSKAVQSRPLPRSFREDLAKADSYLGSRTSYGVQRAAITAAGHPPIVGPLTAAAAAAKYGPPGQEKKQAARHYGMASLAPVGVGVAGAYGGAALAERSPTFARGAQKTLDLKDAAHNKVRSAFGRGPKTPNPTGFMGRAKTRFLGSGAGRRLLGTNPAKMGVRGVGATAGFLGAKAIAGGVGGQAAISLNQRDQNRYNARHGVVRKYAPAPSTKAERTDLAGKKRASAVLSGAGGVAGLTSLQYMLRKKPTKALWAGSIGGGLGGVNALLNVPIQRKEAKAIDPVKKLANLAKRDSLEIKHKDEHPRLLARYGDKGPLPSKLDRETKMKAYEARYVAHGGDKADKYGRRAEAAEGVRNAGLAGATVGGAAWLAARTKPGKRVAGRVAPRVKHMADTMAVG